MCTTNWYLRLIIDFLTDDSTSASSHSSQVLRDVKSLSFLQYDKQLKVDMQMAVNSIQQNGYDLNELAQQSGYKIDVDKLSKCCGETVETLLKSENVSDKAAFELISYLVQHNHNLQVEMHPYFVFNGKSVDTLPLLYDTKLNKSDVGVKVQGTEETNLVTIEVNSSPMDFTIVKTICGLIQFGRLVKAHGIHDQDLVGFALPKLNAKGIAVKVNVKFDCVLMAFKVIVKPLKCSDFVAQLQSAIRNNLTVLTKCKRSGAYCMRFLICLSQDDMKLFGANPVQCYCNNGVLFEADSGGERRCFKKPRLVSNLFNILALSSRKPPITPELGHNIINYEIHISTKVLGYRKVTYNPLSYLEAEHCLHELLTQVYEICEMLSKDSLFHSDVRLPNICFNDEFRVVLIDFDEVEFIENLNMELKIFAKDLIEQAKSNGHAAKHWIKNDNFLSHLCDEGEWCSDLFQTSPINSECLTSIKEVLKRRPV